MELLLQEELAILLEGGCLNEYLSQRDPVVLLPNIIPALVKVVYILPRGHQPVPEPNLILLGDYDAGWGERAVDKVILVERGETLDDGQEGIGDFFLVEVHDVVASFAILDFGLQGGLLLQVEQSIVVPYRS